MRTAAITRGWLRPTLQEVPDLLRQFHGARQPWRPAGLGEHLHWCQPLPWGGQVVSLAANNRILRHSVEDFTIEVEAGLPLGWLQAALAEQGQWLAGVFSNHVKLRRSENPNQWVYLFLMK
ncbi:MAG TPA: hypothetical protein DD643_04930 [Synechococcus sp. UBA8638]|nr:hypothetical protein [Synechococcus sp. UBA8638]